MKTFYTLLVFICTLQCGYANEWKEFHSVAGYCKIEFPEYPQHIKEKLQIEQNLDLLYDAYISHKNQQVVYMMLIAHYPISIEEGKMQASMEGFLNGILNFRPQNELVSADFVEVEGYQALDFFVRNGKLYFKGRAMVVENRLYLLTMECEAHTYDEESYDHFISSFNFYR